MAYNPEDYTPHRGTMKLLNKIIEVNDNYSHCDVHITPNSTFFEPEIQGIYNWVGIEYMAQAVAAFGGFHNEKPCVGFLLSVRRFTSTQAFFPVDCTLNIKAHKVYIEDMVGVFDCEIWLNNTCIAKAKLNTIQPPEDQVKEILGN